MTMATVNSINDNGEYGKEQLADGNHFDAIHNILKGEIIKEEPIEIKRFIENGVCDESYQEDGKFNEPVSNNYEEYLGESKPSLTHFWTNVDTKGSENIFAADNQEVDQIEKEIKVENAKEDPFECTDDFITINADLKTEDGIDIVYEDIKPPLNSHPNTIANIVPNESSIDFGARPQQNSTGDEDETDVGRYNEKGFLINLCLKSFTSSALKYHERTHTGEKPFQCNLCPMSFMRSDTLKYHERIHTGEKPCQCNICPKSFMHEYALKYHERTHTGENPFQCNFCPKSFTKSGELKIHERTHSGERPFQCNFCPKSFTTSRGLKNHERTHTGEKPFQCNLCLKSFMQSNML